MNPFVKGTKKIFLLLLPLIIWEVVEVFFLPNYAFTYRSWEALTVRRISTLPGPFYPDQNISFFNAGDHDPRHQDKFLNFVTDSKGWRNNPDTEKIQDFDVALVGDSNWFGVFLNQDNTLDAILSKKCHCLVYNHAIGLTGNIVSLLRSPWWAQHPSKWVVFELRRGDVLYNNLPNADCDYSYDDPAFASTNLKLSCYPPFWIDHLLVRLPIGFQVVLDRLYKQNFYHFMKSRLGLVSVSYTEHHVEPTDAEKPERMRIALEKILGYKKVLDERGSKLMVFYWPSEDRSLDSFVGMLESHGIPTVGFLPTKDNPAGYDARHWYQEKDSHWRESAVITGADLTWKKLKESGFESSQFNHQANK